MAASYLPSSCIRPSTPVLPSWPRARLKRASAAPSEVGVPAVYTPYSEAMPTSRPASSDRSPAPVRSTLNKGEPKTYL